MMISLLQPLEAQRPLRWWIWKRVKVSARPPVNLGAVSALQSLIRALDDFPEEPPTRVFWPLSLQLVMLRESMM